MECLSCGLGAGYNRVLVELGSETEFGGPCVGCEERRFGDCLRTGLWAETDRCALCARDAYVAMPEWYSETERSSEGVVVRNDYEVTAGTVGLCDEHLAVLTDCHRRRANTSSTPPRPSK